MSEQQTPRKILLATGNPGKFREISAVLSELVDGIDLPPIHWISLEDLPTQVPEPVEDQETFAANAALKACYYSHATGLWTLADDSGLEVDALGGAPGVRSARYSGLPPGAPREEVTRANNAKLIAALAGVGPDRRSARFRCCLALASGDRILATAEGTVEGRIIDEPRGAGGFGYDPHFLLPDLGKTTAELPPEEKNRISHRGKALQRLRVFLPTVCTQPEPS
ncbi:MAG: RdgB/HAM1 family non-canonical purine NTP pyrophosphatase [Planctomycetota bacterium]